MNYHLVKIIRCIIKNINNIEYIKYLNVFITSLIKNINKKNNFKGK